MKRRVKKGSVFNSYDMKTISSLIYSGGRICVSHNDSFFVSPCDKTVNFVEYSSGEVIHTLRDFEHEILAVSLSHDDRKLAVSLGNGDVRIYSTVNNRILRVLHFSSPAVQLDFDPTSPLLALGFGNGLIRVYHVLESRVIYSFTNHVGRIGMVRFHPKEWYLISSSMNGLIISNIKTNEHFRFRNHRGVVLGVCFVNEGKIMITTAVDKMFCVYSLESMKLINKFPVFEDVLDVKIIPKEWVINANSKLTPISPEYQSLPDELILAGSRIGNVTIWDYQSQKPVWKYQPNRVNVNKDSIPCFQFSYIIPTKREVIFTTEECNFVIFSFLPKQPLIKSRQIFGFDEEILDICRVSKGRFATCTTGSDDVLLFNEKTKDCQQLGGHTDIVLSLACSPDQSFIISGGKDRTVRAWHVASLSCCGVVDSHTDAVTCLSFSRDSSFFVTGSDDRTIKLHLMKDIHKSLISSQNKGEKPKNWPLPISFSCQFFAHSKGVTDIDISPDGNFLATCSSDKNAKIFRIRGKNEKKIYDEDDDDDKEEEEENEGEGDNDSNDEENDMRLEHYRLMKHPKGVWCIKFSQFEKVVATGGVDQKIRLWSVESGQCVKLLEGHVSSVLKVDFVNFGTQMISAGSSGVVKLWIIKLNSCVKNWEAHEGSIWGMDVGGQDKGGREILTCGEDSKILRWEENSEVIRGKSAQEEREHAEKAQKLENFVRDGKMGEALVLSIELDQPRRAFQILQNMLSKGLINKIDEVVRSKLGFNEVNYLFQYCVDWNTNSKFCHVAHTVLNSFFRQFDPNFVGWNYEKSLDSLQVYGEKHIKRLEKLIKNTFVLDYTLAQMNVVDEKQEKKILSGSVNNNNKKKRKRRRRKKEKEIGEDEDEEEEDEEEDDDDKEIRDLEPDRKRRKL